MSLDHLRHTFSVGVTLRAGGLPLVELLFAWGGPEGHHTTATVSPTLLGGRVGLRCFRDGVVCFDEEVPVSKCWGTL